MFLKVCHQSAFPTGELLPRKETGGEGGKEVLEKLSKEQRVELLRMFNRCETFFPRNLIGGLKLGWLCFYFLKIKNQKIKNLNNCRMDPNGDGYVDLDEFRTYILEQRMSWSYRRVEKLYNAIR